MIGVGPVLRTAIAAVIIAVIGAACVVNFNNPQPVDFLSHWAAAQLGGGAYDLVAHRAVEASAAPIVDMLPFTHPPPFLLFITPIGYLDYGTAFALWVAATAALFAVANEGEFTHPSAITTGLIGQSAFLTSALIIGGLRLLPVRPWLAGTILGCIVIKPQLGLLLPIALIAGRQWQALGAAAASSLGLLIFSLGLFGVEAFTAFAASAAAFSGYLASGEWQWTELASIYALARYFGAGATPAIVVHFAVAGGAALITWRAWRTGHPKKVAILAAASLLVSPYLFGYDCLLLAAPISALRHRPAIAATIWGLSVLPVAAMFGFYDGPSTLPLATLVAIGACQFARAQ